MSGKKRGATQNNQRSKIITAVITKEESDSGRKTNHCAVSAVDQLALVVGLVIFQSGGGKWRKKGSGNFCPADKKTVARRFG